jgi:hypothetical protein
VRDIEDVAGARDDFQALQQQLLVSPVLYFESGHDITKQVDEEAQALWGETLSMIKYDEAAQRGGVTFSLEGAETDHKRNEASEIELRLGQKGTFRVQLLDKGQPAEAERAEVRWTLRGPAGSGQIDEDTGLYTAPEEFPLRGDALVIVARSIVDPTVTQTVVVRLLDKDGKRRPAETEEEKKEPEEEPKDEPGEE